MFALRAADPIAEALDRLVAGDRLIIAIDQLEKRFTACGWEQERAAFVDAIVRAAADPERRAIVVVALRADYYGQFAAYPALGDLLASSHVLVGPLQPSELRRAVELPAARVRLTLELGLSDALIDDVEGELRGAAAPVHALLELWQDVPTTRSRWPPIARRRRARSGRAPG